MTDDQIARAVLAVVEHVARVTAPAREGDEPALPCPPELRYPTKEAPR